MKFLKKLGTGLAIGTAMITSVANTSVSNGTDLPSPPLYSPRPAYCVELTTPSATYDTLLLKLKPTASPEEVVESLNPTILKKGDETYFHTAIDAVSLKVPVPASNKYYVNELQSLPEVCVAEPGRYININGNPALPRPSVINASFAADITDDHLPWMQQTLTSMLPNLGPKNNEYYEVNVPKGLASSFLKAYKHNPAVNSVRNK